ncbi:MAG: asparagine synthase (glutamine-hydrolyzing) [Bacteroidota bacterium]
MCGIAGFVDFEKKTDKSTIVSVSDTLAHRGPDSSDYFFHPDNEDYTLALGHRRLAIIDLSPSGNQPMFYKDYVLVFNGEIYNYKEIRQELQALGHSFSSSSDTEMILHAYEQWGLKGVEKFIGMFVICLYDRKKHEMQLIRDRAGVKPLYYYYDGRHFVFASELKAFHAYPFFRKEIDQDAVALYLQYGSVPTPYSIFKNTRKLNPGHSLSFDLKSRELSTKKYWDVSDFYHAEKLDISLEEAKKITKEKLVSAFNYRMVSDVPVGVFLSGGYDSTAVTSILQETSAEKIKTFTIGFDVESRNEAPEAKKIAQHLGTEHHEFYCTENDLINIIGDIPYFYDEPFGDPSVTPTMYVSKLASREVKVVLSADGGDEIFAGYNRYEDFVYLKHRLDRTPGIALSAMKLATSLIKPKYLPYLNRKQNFENRYEKLREILKSKSDLSLFYTLSQQFTDRQTEELLKSRIGHPSIFFNELPEFSTPLSMMLSLDYQTYLNDDILHKVDRATMSTSIEGREPFLDHRIIEFVAQLPDEYKFHQGRRKILLKDIVHDYVPESMMTRPKMGFAIPLAEWFNGKLRHTVEDYINQSDIEKQGIFNWQEIKAIKDKFYAGKTEYDFKLWYILMFQMWYRKWM